MPHPAEYLIEDYTERQARVAACVDELCTRFFARFDPRDVSYLGNLALCEFVSNYQVLAAHLAGYIEAAAVSALGPGRHTQRELAGAVAGVMAADAARWLGPLAGVFVPDLLDTVLAPAHAARGEDRDRELQQLLESRAGGTFAAGDAVPAGTVPVGDAAPSAASDPAAVSALRHVIAEHLVHDHHEYVVGNADVAAWLDDVGDELDTMVFSMSEGARYDSPAAAVAGIAETVLPGAAVEVPATVPSSFNCWYVGFGMVEADVLADGAATYYLIDRLQDELEAAGF